MNRFDEIKQRFQTASPQLDERGRRIFAATEARSYGYGGIMEVFKATGVARSTIGRGLKELDDGFVMPPDRKRREGGGRPLLTQSSPHILEDLLKLVAPYTMGDPMRPLEWVSKSLVKLSDALRQRGYQISPNTVFRLLKELGFSRQGNRKAAEGAKHPDRDAQFQHINETVTQCMLAGNPAISIDTKKKELIGDFKNEGSDYREAGRPDIVRTHDFVDKDLGKVVPHGIYDIGQDKGWITVGINNDTAELAVNSLRGWWSEMGQIRYPEASEIVISADGGGSNGSRVRLWKCELQDFANETGLSVTVCHYPPGTSKWNKIEHRLFSFITQNWRGRPLISRQVVLELIGATTNKKGLTVKCVLDTRNYQTGIKVSDEQMSRINIYRHPFHPEWNYTIKPQLEI